MTPTASNPRTEGSGTGSVTPWKASPSVVGTVNPEAKVLCAPPGVNSIMAVFTVCLCHQLGLFDDQPFVPFFPAQSLSVNCWNYVAFIEHWQNRVRQPYEERRLVPVVGIDQFSPRLRPKYS